MLEASVPKRGGRVFVTFARLRCHGIRRWQADLLIHYVQFAARYHDITKYSFDYYGAMGI
jgi:hypothetical protein